MQIQCKKKLNKITGDILAHFGTFWHFVLFFVSLINFLTVGVGNITIVDDQINLVFVD